MTIGKLYQILLLCTAVVATGLLFSCATEENPLTEEEEVEEVEIEEVVIPEPSWADGVVTITTGNYQNAKDLILAINRKRNFYTYLGKGLIDIDTSMPSEPKTVDITAVTLEEAGFTEKTTLKEVRERFRQLGYRPLTIEEMLEFRLQFEDQPDIAQEDLTEEARKWSSVLIFLSEQDTINYSGSEKRSKIFSMLRSSLRDNVGEGFVQGGSFVNAAAIDPRVKNTWKKSWFAEREQGSVFACAIIK